MRRFRRGATNGPELTRPSVPYGQCSIGAPGPMQSVEPREELTPELFHDKQLMDTTQVYDYERDEIDEFIDLTHDK